MDPFSYLVCFLLVIQFEPTNVPIVIATSAFMPVFFCAMCQWIDNQLAEGGR